MRILRVIAALPLLVLLPVAAQAAPIVAGDTVVLTDGPGNTGGGEFNMFVNGSATSFITFCLQRTEYISFNQQYRVGSVTNYADDASGNDPISSQTAWLYTQVRSGTLAGYSHTQTAANALQTAIWYFENEISLTTSQVSSNAFIQAAKGANFSGIGNVRVVNLFAQNGQKAQDQLILQVPGPAALTLIGPGLLALAWYRRRLTPRAVNA
jgi:hypothetical protein